MAIQFSAFDPKTASRAAFEALTDYLNLIRAETLPDDPPIDVEERMGRLQNIPDFVQVAFTVAHEGDLENGGKVVGYSDVAIMLGGDNAHLAQSTVNVLPDYRRQGLGKRLFAGVVDFAQRHNRRLFIVTTSERAPAGEAFMLRLGAHKGLEAHSNQLKVADLDRNLIAEWLRRAPERAAGFTLGLWDGPYPEADLEAICRLEDVMNDQPLGDLEVEDEHMTPEKMRAIEKNVFHPGTHRWTMYVRETATGKLAGFTDVIWVEARPELLQQGATGVFPEYRNLGLGRWLKAAMLQKVLDELPQVKYIRTRNADSNAAMLGINNALGFKPYSSEVLWQFEVETALAYLHTEKVVA